MKAKVQNSTFHNTQGRRFQSKNRSLTLNQNNGNNKAAFPAQLGAKQHKPAKGKNPSLVNPNTRVFAAPANLAASTVPAALAPPVALPVPAPPTQKKFRVVHSQTSATPNLAPSSPTHKETTIPTSTPAVITTTPTPARVLLVRPLSPTKSISIDSTPATSTSSVVNEDKKRTREECVLPPTTTTTTKAKRLRISSSSRSPSQSPPLSPTATESHSPLSTPCPSPSSISAADSLPSIESEVICPPSPTQVISSSPAYAPSSPLPISSPSHSAPSSPLTTSSPVSTPRTVEVPITPLPPSSCSTTHDYIEEWMEEEERALKSTLSSPVSFSSRMEGINNENQSRDLSWAEDW